jgi:hypothetical protein
MSTPPRPNLPDLARLVHGPKQACSRQQKTITIATLADNLRQAPPLATPLQPASLRQLMQEVDDITRSLAHLAHFNERREGWIATIMPVLSVN